MKKINVLLSLVLFFCFTISNVEAQKDTEKNQIQEAKVSQISGLGTTNYVAKFTSSTSIGNSCIYDNGKVGIGTTSPGYKFDLISWQLDWVSRIWNPASLGKGLLIKAASTQYDNPILELQEIGGGNTRFVVLASGKTGINTSSPQANLHVVGSARISDLGGSGTKMVVTDNIRRQHYHGRDNIGILIDVRGDKAYESNFYSGIFLGGNVGIGTEKPDALLAVMGEIKCQEVLVTLKNWSDHIFNNNYKLMSISQLEKYINENNHLPGIPSDQEVKENGINLGEMDAKLLQKIEELTLYVIQQQKEIDNLKTQINELKKAQL